ncbi:MAG: zinc ribbon domain-containing protein [Methanobacteriota archaeon]|nr:MAG: zinc ribbon domain-containing protein [Euryarchaeota archaeon]
MSGDDIMMFDNYHPFFGFWMLGILVLLVIALLVASDASKFGENGFLWGFVVFIMPMMGLLIYAIVRSGWVIKTSSIPSTTVPVQTKVPTTSQPAPTQYPSTSIAVAPSTAPTDVIYCTICGTPNPNDAVFCKKCGNKIPGGA